MASDHLRLFGTTAPGRMRARAVVRPARSPDLARRLPAVASYPPLARHYCDETLPETGTLSARVMSGERTLVADAFRSGGCRREVGGLAESWRARQDSNL